MKFWIGALAKNNFQLQTFVNRALGPQVQLKQSITTTVLEKIFYSEFNK
jgi:hypothetical protein